MQGVGSPNTQIVQGSTFTKMKENYGFPSSTLPLPYHYVQLIPYFYFCISGFSLASFFSQFLISNLLVFTLPHPWYVYFLSAYYIYSSFSYFRLLNVKFCVLLNSWQISTFSPGNVLSSPNSELPNKRTLCRSLLDYSNYNLL